MSGYGEESVGCLFGFLERQDVLLHVTSHTIKPLCQCLIQVRISTPCDADLYRRPAGGFLTDHFPEATKAVWHFDGIYAQSRHIPGVRFAGLIHPGEHPDGALLASFPRMTA